MTSPSPNWKPRKTQPEAASRSFFTLYLRTSATTEPSNLETTEQRNQERKRLKWNKQNSKKLRIFTTDFCIALAITLFITLFTLFELPPLSSVQAFNDKLKEAAAEEYGEPPYGHAEASSLKSFCRRTGIELTDATAKLAAAKLQGVSPDATLAEIATANRMTPQQLFNTFKPAPVAGEAKTLPPQPGMGFGRKPLSSVCAEYGLDLDTIIEGLKSRGIEATSESSMKEIGENNGMDPHAVFEVIRELATK